MFGIKTSPSTEAPARLLRPARVLWRVQPVEVSWLNDDPYDERSERYVYDYRAYTLAAVFTNFKAGAGQGEWCDGCWAGRLGDVLRQVEALDWFEIDWLRVEQDEETDMQIDEEEGSFLARWLWEIPVMRYGFSSWEDSWPEESPGMALLKGILDKEWHGGGDILVDIIENYTLRVNNVPLVQVQERLETADFTAYPPPLCWLPLIARIACNSTGDPLLDYQNFYEDDPPAYFWHDPEKARAAYRQAKPSIERLKTFLEWCVGGEEMQQVLDALTGGRKRKPRKRKGNTLLEILTPEIER